MRLFLYGMLLDADRLARLGGDPGLPARLRPAVLRGFRRVAGAGGYPTLAPDRAGRVEGAVLGVSAAALRRLQAYEGPRYRLSPVRVETEAGPAAAFAWIAGAAKRRPWEP
jgi:gamma-glutamylcyclotransferase (GGCT)/AIG2-like uncharacterized protein YtfP